MNAATRNPGVIAVADAKMAGAIVWWRLTGHLNLDKLAAAWAAAGLDVKLLPGSPSPVAAMHRAAEEQSGKRRLIRPLQGTRGWAVVDETVKDDKLEYQQLCTVRLNETQLLIEPHDSELAPKIQDRFDYYQRTLTINDSSGWITSLARHLKAVSLRETGGVYFIPETAVDDFRKMAGVIAEVCDHVIYEVPALQTDKAVTAILDAVLREADQEVSMMETELDTGDLKERALNNRLGKTQTITEKIEVYETLLGKSLDGMRDRLEALKAQITMAALASPVASA